MMKAQAKVEWRVESGPYSTGEDGGQTMSEQAENVRILRDAYESWDRNKGTDLSCWTPIIDDDARLVSLADGADSVPFTRQRSGRSEFIEYLEELTHDWEIVFYRIDEYVAERDRVVAIGSCAVKNKLTSKIATTAKVDVWRMRDGKAIEFAEYYDTARLYAAAQP
jgi:ketosteroid isomerase-like protein